MAQGFIPAASPVARAVNGWPSSPIRKPVTNVKASTKVLQNPNDWIWLPESKRTLGLAYDVDISANSTYTLETADRGIILKTNTNQEYVNLPSIAECTDFTFICRFALSSTAVNQCIFSNWSESGDKILVRLDQAQLEVYLSQSAATKGPINVANANTSDWNLVAVRKTGTVFDVYTEKNGWSSTAACNSIFAAGSGLHLGDGDGGSATEQRFDARVDFYAFLHRSLSNAEIYAIEADTKYLLEPANQSPIPLSPAQAASVTQGAVPASSPVVRAVRGFDGE